ncbi:sirohydrochlorin chelatase [Streptomyces pathocidini]|uniref:Sirohydrochlorin chelatase n=1 Tax=Streptomyces pathocidini TaxID=1650571 RepID=A0ABW7UTZ9_9ACTN
MTASISRSGSPDHPGPAHLDSAAHLDSGAQLMDTAQLMAQITAQLSTQLPLAGARSLRRAPRPAPGHGPFRPPALVAVAHGSRDPEALRTVTALLDRVRAIRPELPVRLGHIELDDLPLTDTLAALRGEAVLVPLLLGRGHHVKRDIPRAVAGAPHLHARVAPPLGPHPLLAQALHDRLAEAGWRTPAGGPALARYGVVLAAAGSRDPESAADAARMAALLGGRLGVPVLPAYASAAAPTVPEAVAALRARGRHRIAVASYFTAPGRFAAQTAESAPGPAAAPLGAHPALARLLLHRYDQALAAAHAPAGTAGLAGQPHLATA